MKTYYKKYFLFSWVFLVFSSVVSNATVIEPSPANSIKRFLERSLFLLIVIVSVFLIVSILKMLFSKNFDLIKRLKIKVFRGVRCKYWFFGHFHTSITSSLEDTIYKCLDINELYMFRNHE